MIIVYLIKAVIGKLFIIPFIVKLPEISSVSLAYTYLYSKVIYATIE